MHLHILSILLMALIGISCKQNVNTEGTDYCDQTSTETIPSTSGVSKTISSGDKVAESFYVYSNTTLKKVMLKFSTNNIFGVTVSIYKGSSTADPDAGTLLTTFYYSTNSSSSVSEVWMDLPTSLSLETLNADYRYFMVISAVGNIDVDYGDKPSSGSIEKYYEYNGAWTSSNTKSVTVGFQFAESC